MPGEDAHVTSGPRNATAIMMLTVRSPAHGQPATLTTAGWKLLTTLASVATVTGWYQFAVTLRPHPHRSRWR